MESSSPLSSCAECEIEFGLIRFGLVRNLVLDVLDHIISLSSETLRTVVDDLQHVLCRLLLRRIRNEPLAQLFDRSAAEAGQTRVKHQRYERDDRFSVLPIGKSKTTQNVNENQEKLKINRSRFLCK